MFLFKLFSRLLFSFRFDSFFNLDKSSARLSVCLFLCSSIGNARLRPLFSSSTFPWSSWADLFTSPGGNYARRRVFSSPHTPVSMNLPSHGRVGIRLFVAAEWTASTRSWSTHSRAVAHLVIAYAFDLHAHCSSLLTRKNKKKKKQN